MLGKKDSRHVRGKVELEPRLPPARLPLPPQALGPGHYCCSDHCHGPWCQPAGRFTHIHSFTPVSPRYYYSHFPAQKVKLQTVCQLPKATEFSGEARDFPGSASMTPKHASPSLCVLQRLCLCVLYCVLPSRHEDTAHLDTPSGTAFG